MRKTKKIISLVLCFAMILTTLTGCASSNPSKRWLNIFSEIINADNFTFAETTDVQISKEALEYEKDIYFILNIEGSTSVKNKENLLDINLNYNKFNDNLTTVILNEETLYLNIAEILDAISVLAEVEKDEVTELISAYFGEIDNNEIISIKLKDLYEGDFWNDFISNNGINNNELLKEINDFVSSTLKTVILNSNSVTISRENLLNPSFVLKINKNNFINFIEVSINTLLNNINTMHNIYTKVCKQNNIKDIITIDELKIELEDLLKELSNMSQETLNEIPNFAINIKLKEEGKKYYIDTNLEIDSVISIKDSMFVNTKTPEKLEIPEAYTVDIAALGIEPIEEMNTNDIFQLITENLMVNENYDMLDGPETEQM